MTLNPVVAVVSPKGGNGKTTISANLAVAMTRFSTPVIVDLDVHFGDVEYAFRLSPFHRLDGVVQVMRDRPRDGIEHLLTPHPTGVFALCAPADPVSADYLKVDEVLGVVDALIRLERPIVLDTAGGIGEFSLGALDRATETVIVCGTDVPSVQAVKKLLETMRQLDMDMSRSHLVVNRSTARCGLSVSDVEQAVGLDAELEVPEHASFAAGMNQGCPVTESDPRSAMAVPFVEFSNRLLGIDRRKGFRALKFAKVTA
jgi:pilus assembly protein CpaE